MLAWMKVRFRQPFVETCQVWFPYIASSTNPVNPKLSIYSHTLWF